MLPAPYRQRIENLLRDYVELRIVDEPLQAAKAVHDSEALHEALWIEAKQAAADYAESDGTGELEWPPAQIVGLFVQSLNDVIDLHEERVAVAIYRRLPWSSPRSSRSPC